MDGPPPMAGKGKERHLERSLRTQKIAVAPLHERPRVFTGIITGKYFSLVGIAAVFLFPPPNRSIWQPTKQCKRPMQVRKAASPPTRMVALSLRRLPGSVCYDCSRWWGHFTFSFQGTFQHIKHVRNADAGQKLQKAVAPSSFQVISFLRFLAHCQQC